MILHIDMDAFFASIEQAINPALKGKPLIVGSRPNKYYTVVCAASYEAKALGIDSGMSSKEAFAICPHLAFIAADQSKYIWTSEQILHMLSMLGFTTNYASIDEFQIEVPEEAHPQNIAQAIRAQIHARFAITASVGIAKNYLLAKLASKLNKPNGMLEINEQNLVETLTRTPVEKLCGIGAKSAQKLHTLNIMTCLELYLTPPKRLQEIFGKNGLTLYQGLHGYEHLEPVDQDAKPKSIGHSYTLPRASENPDFIKAWIKLLSEMVGRRLRQHDLAAKTVHLWLHSPEITSIASQKTLQNHTQDSCDIYNQCLGIMAKIGPRMPKIRALGITCSNLSSEQHAPLFNFQRKRRDLLQTIDTINNRFGEDSIYPAAIELAKKLKE